MKEIIKQCLTSFKFLSCSVYDIYPDSEFRLGTYMFPVKCFSALTWFSSYYISFELISPGLVVSCIPLTLESDLFSLLSRPLMEKDMESSSSPGSV